MPVSATEMKSKQSDSDRYADMKDDELASEVIGRTPRHVVITGGEPCAYDLSTLTGLLIGAGKTVQIETSGTHQISCHEKTWVTVSPKFSMPGGLAIDWRSMRRANEIKMPVGKQPDVDKVLEVQKLMIDCGHWTNRFPIWLQPLSQSPKATALCVDAATRHGFKISIQVHKYMGLR